MKFNNHNNDNPFEHNHSNGFVVDHNSIHKTFHKTSYHEDIHNHNKIHEGMYLGKSNVFSPLNNNFDKNK